VVSRDVLADLNENWAAWLDFTAEHVAGGGSRAFGAIRCSSVGAPVPVPQFNQAFVFEEPSVDDLAQATSWLSERNVAFWVTAPDFVARAVADLAEPAGLDPTATTMPGMAFAPLAELPAEANGDVEILPVTSAAPFEDVALVTADVFGAPLEGARTIAPASMLDNDRCSWFVGYVDGEVAACGQLLRTADVAGVYGIGVREQFRRRGLGASITRAALAAGRDLGCSIGVLQASPMGEPVYHRMGFETVTQYHRFVASG
jgi:GNAT superfamily N-acetyltransferase